MRIPSARGPSAQRTALRETGVALFNVYSIFAGPVRGARVAERQQGAVQTDPGELPEPVDVPEQQREPGEQARQAGHDGQPDVVQGRRLRQPVRHAATGHEDEAEAVEKVGFHGLGRAVAAGLAGGRVAAAHVHGRQQPRTTSKGPSPEEAIQHHAEQLPEESTVSQVSDCAGAPGVCALLPSRVGFARSAALVGFPLERVQNALTFRPKSLRER